LGESVGLVLQGMAGVPAKKKGMAGVPEKKGMAVDRCRCLSMIHARPPRIITVFSFSGQSSLSERLLT